MISSWVAAPKRDRCMAEPCACVRSDCDVETTLLATNVHSSQEMRDAVIAMIARAPPVATTVVNASVDELQQRSNTARRNCRRNAATDDDESSWKTAPPPSL